MARAGPRYCTFVVSPVRVYGSVLDLLHGFILRPLLVTATAAAAALGGSAGSY